MTGATSARRDPTSARAVWTLISGFLAFCLLGLAVPNGATSTSSTVAVAEDEVEAAGSTSVGDAAAQRFTISASGDILIHERVAEAASTTGSYNFGSLFEPVKATISSADLALCHLEVPISSTDADLAFGGSADGGAFRAPMQLADALVEVGFDGCSVASNHSYDSGESSVFSTVRQLGRVGVAHAGVANSLESASRLWQFPIGDSIVGHLSYTYGINGRESGDVPAHHVARIDEATILADAARQRAAGSTFVVVSMHWGDEFSTSLNDDQATLGPRLISSDDIDLIIGHHAHVPQQIERYDGGVVAFGLGNLLSNQSSSAPECPTACPLESQDGAIVDFVVERDLDGTSSIVDVNVHPTWVDVGTTWKVLLADEPPPAGTGADIQILEASAERTRMTTKIDR